MKKTLLVSLIMVVCLSSGAARAAEWNERIRGVALGLIREAIQKRPRDQQLRLLEKHLAEAQLKESPGQYYLAYAIRESQKIFTGRTLQTMPLHLAAETLIHESGHLIGLDECGADQLSAFVIQHSISSQGLVMSPNPFTCPQLLDLYCGLPVLLEKPATPVQLTSLTDRQLKHRIKSLPATPKNVFDRLYFVERVQGWVGGNSCDRPISGDFNGALGLTYANFFLHQARPAMTQYLNQEHASDLHEAQAELERRQASDRH